MSTPRTDVDEWVLASAAEVARNVARHGVPIAWSEAAERLRRTVELLSGPVFVVDDGGTFTPLPQQEIPRWQETGFAESVACAAVHYAGQPYYPENPQSSRVELAIPWDTATELVQAAEPDGRRPAKRRICKMQTDRRCGHRRCPDRYYRELISVGGVVRASSNVDWNQPSFHPSTDRDAVELLGLS